MLISVLGEPLKSKNKNLYAVFLILSFCFAVFIPTPALADTNERDLNPDKEDIVSSYSFGPYQSDKWSVVAVDTPDINNPGSGVTIAILDSGVTKTENLSCHNFVHEYDSYWQISGPGSALDISGHGTTVAHTIADCSDGIANSVNIMPVRVFTDYYAPWGFPTYTDDWALAEGIIWAVNHGADIINMSLGSPCYKTWEEGCRGDDTYPGWVDNAIQYASNNGVLIVAASGNSALPWVSFPANHPDVWAVGAVDINLDKSYFSNSGEALTFVGPGENVETALGNVSGTSFSSPEVAAAAAVLKGSMPGLSVKEIEDAFVCTIVDLGDQGWDPEYGWGMPQIQASLDLLQAGLLQTPWWVSSELILSFAGEGVIRATWESANDCNNIEYYFIDIEPGGSNTVTYADNATEFLVSESGVYTVYAKAINEFGNHSELISNTIEIDLTPPSWDNGTGITINLDGDNLIYSWNGASDLNSISRYELLVERDGLFVVQINTLDTSAAFNSGYFEEPGVYTVIVSAFDPYENSSSIFTQFQILEPEPTSSSNDGESSTATTIPTFTRLSTTTTISEYMMPTETTTTIPSSTTTVVVVSYTPTGNLSGSCPLLSNPDAASKPYFGAENNDTFPMGPRALAYKGYEGCKYSGLSRDEIKDELKRYLEYWSQFSGNEFRYLESVHSRDWRNEDELNGAVNRWDSEWSGIDPSSIVENLSNSDGQLVWDDSHWTTPTTTIPAISDPDTTNTVLGAPTITGVTLSPKASGSDPGIDLIVSKDHAPSVQGLDIIKYSYQYYTVEGGPQGGGSDPHSRTNPLLFEIPSGYDTVYIKIRAEYGEYVACESGQPNCFTTINNQWGPYTDWYAVVVNEPSSESDDSSTTTTTTLPPTNPTTTIPSCISLEEAKARWRSDNENTKRGYGNVGWYYVEDSGGSSAYVNGSQSTVRLIQQTGTWSVGDTYLEGVSGDFGLILWTSTIVEDHGDGYYDYEANPIYPDAAVEAHAISEYTGNSGTHADPNICPSEIP